MVEPLPTATWALAPQQENGLTSRRPPSVMSRKTRKTVIQASGDSLLTCLTEAWQRRDLAFYLVQRDLILRYKQSLLGVGWVLLQPISMMLIFTAVFSRIARVQVAGPPYALYVFAALLIWQMFSVSLSRGATSVVSSANLVTKVYFPRVIIPVSSAFVPIIDFAISLLVFLVMAAFYGYYPSTSLLFLPVFLFLCICLSTGLSLWFSAIHVRYRDIGYILPLILQVWMYLTPVVYPSSLVPSHWLLYYNLNPLISIIDGARWILLGTAAPDFASVLYSSAISAITLFSGLLFFQNQEGYFSDEI